MSTVKELLGQIISGDHEAAAETFSSVMADKQAEAVESLRAPVAKTMFGEGKTEYEKGKDEFEADKEKEEEEDEADDQGKNDSDADGDEGKADDADGDGKGKNGDDSDSDEDEADGKPKQKVKEDVDSINELKDSTLRSYMYKASPRSQEAANKARNLRVLADPDDPDEQDKLNSVADKYSKIAAKRRAGLKVAAKKLAD